MLLSSHQEAVKVESQPLELGTCLLLSSPCTPTMHSAEVTGNRAQLDCSQVSLVACLQVLSFIAYFEFTKHSNFPNDLKF